MDDSELVALLVDIRSLIEQSQSQNVLLAGDLNCHFERYTRFTTIIKDSLSEQSLSLVWQHPDSDPNHTIQAVDYTFCNVTNRVASYSTIDHFVTSPRIFKAITEAGVIHSGENQSNHSAIFIKFKVGALDLTLEESKAQSRASWEKANSEAKENFKSTLSDKLDIIAIPNCIGCQDVQCRSEYHYENIEEYTMNIFEAMEAAGKECLPRTGSNNSDKTKRIAGWTEHVKPYSEESKFWFQVWVSEGKPRFGPIFDNMKLSKKQFKYAVRRLKRVNDRIQNDKFVSGLLHGGVDIFKEIRKFRGTSSSYSSRIDEEVGASNIANHFAEIYEKLYNNVEPGPKLDTVRGAVHGGVNQQSQLQLNRISEDVIRDALNLMKANKKDAVFDITSDFYINGPPQVVTHLTNLVRLCVSHGTVPYFVLLCTLLPLVKDNLGDVTASDNYRAIAGGCLLLKLFDLVILILEGDKLGFDELQFAYQAKASTTMCTWLVTAVVDYFNKKGATVYGAAMDMSKAFDMVEWSELFQTLIERNVDPIFLRLILYIYEHQHCDVKWGSKYSTRFTVSNGVRQGGVSSGNFLCCLH